MVHIITHAQVRGDKVQEILGVVGLYTQFHYRLEQRGRFILSKDLRLGGQNDVSAHLVVQTSTPSPPPKKNEIIYGFMNRTFRRTLRSPYDMSRPSVVCDVGARGLGVVGSVLLEI